MNMRKKFHQDVAQMKKRYSGKWSENMLTDYYWTHSLWETPKKQYKRQKKTKWGLIDCYINDIVHFMFLNLYTSVKWYINILEKPLLSLFQMCLS